MAIVPQRNINRTIRKPEVKMASENEKKQVPLRLNKKLWEELCAWAEDDFRSLNGQIEYLLSELVKQRKKPKSRQEDGDA